MAANKENSQRQNYSIKLLAGNNVVLVEADKYESEVFAPQIVNGRITFLNIIPNRRCCTDTKSGLVNYANNIPREQPRVYLKDPNVKLRKCERLSAGQSYAANAPLANSTPVDVKKRSSCDNRLFSCGSCTNTNDITLLTPEPVRKAVAARPIMWDKSIPSLPKDVAPSQIQHNTSQSTPKTVGRIVPRAINSNSIGKDANASLLSESFILPCSPSISSRSGNKRSADKLRLGYIPSWQKVLTPVRTYTKKSSKAVIIRRPVMVNSAKKILKSKYKPTYLVNPTKGPDVSMQVEIMKRKIIIDAKISISPKTFKKQQNEPLDSNRRKTKTYLKSLGFHKTRPQLETMNLSAFDLLTNSNRRRLMSRKLNEQFRKGCVNKASSTYSKYKLLSTVPPLEQDDQVLQISTTSL